MGQGKDVQPRERRTMTDEEKAVRAATRAAKKQLDNRALSSLAKSRFFSQAPVAATASKGGATSSGTFIAVDPLVAPTTEAQAHDTTFVNRTNGEAPLRPENHSGASYPII